MVYLRRGDEMAKKIFVSYKYADDNVYQDERLDAISLGWGYQAVTPRSYLNELSNILKDYAIEKWEQDDEDLSQFKDETIKTHLKDKIYDSSLTIVLISPGMNNGTAESDQWIPWEVSYSIRESTRNGITSHMNAMLAVVLPDVLGSYDYCIEEKILCDVQTLKFSSSFCFNIIGDNFFNKKEPDSYKCNLCGNKHYRGPDNHYFAYVKWDDFKNDFETYINRAYEHQERADEYNIVKTVG